MAVPQSTIKYVNGETAEAVMELIATSNNIQAALALGYGLLSEDQEAALLDLLSEIDALLQEAGLAVG